MAEMVNLDKIIDEQLRHVKNIGCVVKIIDEDDQEEEEEKYCDE